jgi:predicted nucleotidyltransferase
MDGSDVDFLVEFNEPLRPGIFDRFLALRNSLERITGCRVDLVECSSIQNPVLRQRIDEDRRLVYAA